MVELLIGLTAGLVLGSALVQLLLAEGRSAALLSARLRSGVEQRRTLELIRSDLQRASQLSVGAAPAAGCPLSGRRVVLHLQGAMAPVTYSLGAAPSAIWRGQVLMRCGPAFTLEGEPSNGASQNRVLLDALANDGLSLSTRPDGQLELELRQQASGSPASAAASRVSASAGAGTGTAAGIALRSRIVLADPGAY